MIAPFSNEELESGRQHHKPTGWVVGAKGVNCQLCAKRWPCSPARFLANIDALRWLAGAKDALVEEGMDDLDSYQITTKLDESLALTVKDYPA